jgi:hypothetical protein
MFDRDQQRVIILFPHKESVQLAEIHQKLAAQPCKDRYSKQSIKRWSAQSVGGRKDIEDSDDDYRSGRPPIDYLDITILACLESEPFQSAYSLVEMIYHSLVLVSVSVVLLSKCRSQSDEKRLMCTGDT